MITTSEAIVLASAAELVIESESENPDPYLLHTTKGPVEIHRLQRRLIFSDLRDNYAVALEFYLDGELVRRDAHVILKRVPAEAPALAGGV